MREHVRYFLCALCVYMFAQRLDLTKPNWTLRVVIDKSKTGSIEVKKDTERLDQIKAIKKAWEMAEPGRSAKVTQNGITMFISIWALPVLKHRLQTECLAVFSGFTVSSQVS